MRAQSCETVLPQLFFFFFFAFSAFSFFGPASVQVSTGLFACGETAYSPILSTSSGKSLLVNFRGSFLGCPLYFWHSIPEEYTVSFLEKHLW